MPKDEFIRSETSYEQTLAALQPPRTALNYFSLLVPL
jgi:hypothetical protein